MAEKRKQHEMKLILLLAVCSLVFYGLFAGLYVLNQKNAAADPTLAVNMQDLVQKMEATSSGETFDLYKEKGSWYTLTHQDVPLNQTEITAMAAAFNDLGTDRIIEDGSQYFSQFGLDQPQYVLEATDQNETRTYLVGNYNPILQQYYVTIEGSDQVYLVPLKKMAKGMKTFLEIVDTPEVKSMSTSDIEAYQMASSGESYRAYQSDGIYIFERSGQSYESDAYAATNIFYALKNIAYDTCLSYDASEAQLADYGFDSPDVTVGLELTDGTLYQIYFAEAEDGSAYVNVEGTAQVYQITSSEYESIKEKSALSYFIEGADS